MTALLLTLALLTPARADDLAVRVGVGWVEESAAAGGVLSARRNSVVLWRRLR